MKAGLLLPVTLLSQGPRAPRRVGRPPSLWEPLCPPRSGAISLGGLSPLTPSTHTNGRAGRAELRAGVRVCH